MPASRTSLADVRHRLRGGGRRRRTGPAGRATRVSRLASGGQAEPDRRDGRGAQTGGDVQPHVRAPAGGAAGAGAVDAAVGDDRAVAREAGAGRRGCGPRARGRSRRRRTRRARGARGSGSGRGCSVGVGVGCGPAMQVVAVVPDVRVVDARDGDRDAGRRRSCSRVCVASCQPRSISAARRSRHGRPAAVDALLRAGTGSGRGS